MTLSSSPYAVFKAVEWHHTVAMPIGIGQYEGLQPKKIIPIKNSLKLKRVAYLKNILMQACTALFILTCQRSSQLHV